MRTAPSRSARFVRMQPAHTIAPISIDLKIGRACCCRWCNGHLPLCQGAAAQGHQAMRLAAASLMPPFVAHASTNSGRIVDASEQCVHFCECMCDLQCTCWCCRACNPSHNMSLRVQVHDEAEHIYNSLLWLALRVTCVEVGQLNVRTLVAAASMNFPNRKNRTDSAYTRTLDKMPNTIPCDVYNWLWPFLMLTCSLLAFKRLSHTTTTTYVHL